MKTRCIFLNFTDPLILAFKLILHCGVTSTKYLMRLYLSENKEIVRFGRK